MAPNSGVYRKELRKETRFERGVIFDWYKRTRADKREALHERRENSSHAYCQLQGTQLFWLLQTHWSRSKRLASLGKRSAHSKFNLVGTRKFAQTTHHRVL